jgi:hypothetical protein
MPRHRRKGIDFMRTMFAAAVLAAALISPALAQTGTLPAYPPGSAPPPPGYVAPPSPGYAAPPPGYAAPPPGYAAGQAAPSAMPAAPPNAQYEPPSAMPQSHRASNIDQRDTRSEVAPNLPSPEIGSNAGPVAYLRAAQAALAAGRTGETQEALEQAQTRLLDRSVPYGQVNAPSENPAVAQISQALHALAAGDRAQCMQLIQSAIPAARASLR